MPDDPILPIDDPLLTKPSALVKFIDCSIKQLAEEMFAIMDREQGAGLAAVQIGRPLRLVVMDVPDSDGKRHRMAMVNPKVTKRSSEIVVSDEGCLSMPGYFIPVPRHKEIEVHFQDLVGVAHSIYATGPLSVCVQHEVDHIEGILFFDRVSRLRRQRARDYFGKVRRRHKA